MASKVVLITGCSTGIGQDLARHLTQAGYSVAATARRPETLADLPTALKLPLDVSDPASIASAIAEVIRHFGRIDVLVNNAGYATRGAIEEIPNEDLQKLFEVNVYGVVRMVRAVVPHMREQKSGCIVNIGSITGRMVTPVNGTYAATKFALEALSDALRSELALFGVRVVLIEPGGIQTQFAAKATTYGQGILSNPDSPYRALYQRFPEVMNSMGGQRPGPQVVSKVVQQAIETSRPKARYIVAVSPGLRLALLLGDSLRDAIIRRVFHIHPPAGQE